MKPLKTLSIILFCVGLGILPELVSAQKSQGFISFGAGIGMSNLDDFPVKLGQKDNNMSNLISSSNFGVCVIKNKNQFGIHFQMNSSFRDKSSNSNFGQFTSEAVDWSYGRVFFSESKFTVCPTLKIGFQTNTFVISNDTNHLTNSLNTGNTQELTTVSMQARASLGIQFRYQFSKNRILAFYAEGTSGLYPSAIRTYSNAKIPNQTFNPAFFQLGLSYVMLMR